MFLKNNHIQHLTLYWSNLSKTNRQQHHKFFKKTGIMTKYYHTPSKTTSLLLVISSLKYKTLTSGAWISEAEKKAPVIWDTMWGSVLQTRRTEPKHSADLVLHGSISIWVMWRKVEAPIAASQPSRYPRMNFISDLLCLHPHLTCICEYEAKKKSSLTCHNHILSIEWINKKTIFII